MSDVFERYMTPREERQLFATVSRHGGILARRDHAWMRAMRFTGIRVGALSRLTVGDVREGLRTGYLELRPEIQKGKRRHKVYLARRKARPAFRKLLSIRREMGYPEVDDGPLIMSRNHRGMSVRSFQARMKFWREAAGLSVDVSPHWFRHTLAKRLMSQSTAENPLQVVQGVLGHASVSTTAVYTRPDREALEQALEDAS